MDQVPLAHRVRQKLMIASKALNELAIKVGRLIAFNSAARTNGLPKSPPRTSSGQTKPSGRSERLNAWVLVLGMLFEHWFEDFGISFHRQHHGALLHTIGTGGHSGNDLAFIGHGHANGEGAIFAQADRLAP